MDSAASTLPRFQAAVEAGDVATAQSDLNKLKIDMTQFPSQAGSGGYSTPPPAEIALGRAILETAVFFNVKSGDFTAFERHFALLKSYYQGAFTETPAATESRHHVFGLVLMHRLVSSRLPEFHALLEVLTPAERTTSPFIAFAVRLEAAMMEGSYNRVLAARASAPSPYYLPFLGRLDETVRSEVADCMAAGYPRLSLAAAQKMLMLGSVDETVAWVRAAKPEWTLNSRDIVFSAEKEGRAGLDASGTIAQTLGYAVEVERIV